jgi:hypothetical protein
MDVDFGFWIADFGLVRGLRLLKDDNPGRANPPAVGLAKAEGARPTFIHLNPSSFHHIQLTQTSSPFSANQAPSTKNFPEHRTPNTPSTINH